jgi:N4-gp56 family major capsid protein
MTIQTVTSALSGGQNLPNSVRTQYIEDYLQAAEMARIYDQLAAPIGKDMSNLARGSAVQVDVLSDMQPGTSAISEVADITPQALRDATLSLTPTSRGEALQCSEKLLIQAYTDYGARMYGTVGKALMESLEVLARDAACQGSLVLRPDAAGTRAGLTASSTGHRATDGLFSEAATLLETLKCPGFKAMGGGRRWAAIMHPAVFHDIREDGNVNSIGIYQDKGITLNYELGSIGPFALVVSSWAKVFGGAGAALSKPTSYAYYTLTSSVAALDTTIIMSTVTHLDAPTNKWFTIGTRESGDTHYPMNEMVRYISHATGVATIIGEGPNGGLRFDHAAASWVGNASDVFTIVFGGPTSLAKVYDPGVGEFGQIVGPKRDGLVDQFVTLGFKWYGNYGRMSQSWLVRDEVASSFSVM